MVNPFVDSTMCCVGTNRSRLTYNSKLGRSSNTGGTIFGLFAAPSSANKKLAFESSSEKFAAKSWGTLIIAYVSHDVQDLLGYSSTTAKIYELQLQQQQQPSDLKETLQLEDGDA